MDKSSRRLESVDIYIREIHARCARRILTPPRGGKTRNPQQEKTLQVNTVGPLFPDRLFIALSIKLLLTP